MISNRTQPDFAIFQKSNNNNSARLSRSSYCGRQSSTRLTRGPVPTILSTLHSSQSPGQQDERKREQRSHGQEIPRWSAECAASLSESFSILSRRRHQAAEEGMCQSDLNPPADTNTNLRMWTHVASLMFAHYSQCFHKIVLAKPHALGPQNHTAVPTTPFSPTRLHPHPPRRPIPRQASSPSQAP